MFEARGPQPVLRNPRRAGVHSALAVATVLVTVIAAASLERARAADVLQQVISRGTLRIATLGSLPPFSQVSPSGEMDGYEIEIGRRLAAALNVKAEFTSTDSAGRVASLQTKKADLTIADFTRTVSRSTVIAFSDPYLITYQTAMVVDGSPVKTAAELNDAKYQIGVNRGGVGEQTARSWFPKARVSRFSANADVLSALQAGQIDAMVEDSYYNSGAIQNDPGKLRQLPEQLTRLEIAMGLSTADPDLLRVVNLWIEQFNASGENDKLFKKWFGVDMVH